MNKNKNETTENVNVLLMSVTFNTQTNSYTVELGKGSNVPEVAFDMTVVMKCLLRDGLIKDFNEVIDLIKKYLEDPQYEELEQIMEETTK